MYQVFKNLTSNKRYTADLNPKAFLVSSTCSEKYLTVSYSHVNEIYIWESLTLYKNNANNNPFKL
jgi:hypothetical protein